jgi:predicted exporter
MTHPRWLFVWLAILVGIGAWSALQLRQEGAIRSDLLALLPKESKDGSSEAALAHLTQAGGNRAFLIVVDRDAAASVQAVERLADSLQASQAFVRVIAKVPPPETKSVVAFYRNAAPLLGPTSPHHDLGQKFLARSYGTFSTTGPLRLTEDPFGLASAWLVAMPWPQANFRWQDGYLITPTAGGIATLVILELPADSSRYEWQVSAVAAVTTAETAMKRAQPSAVLQRLGGVFYAEAAQTEARADTDRIGLGSAIGVVLLMLLVFRSLSMLAVGFLSIATGVVAGTAAVLGVFGEIHLITLVFGVSLIGEASDYAIQLVSAKLADDEEGRSDWLRRVTPGLCMALGTSLLGYAAMTLVPLPSIRQIAVFALAGLAAAFVTVLLSGPVAAKAIPGGRVAATFGRLAQGLRTWSARLGRLAMWTGIAAFALGLILATHVAPDDDVRSLIHRPEKLVTDEAAVKQALGTEISTQFLLIHPAAGTDEACLLTEEALTSALQRCRKLKHIAGWTSLADVIPSHARQQASLEAYRAALLSERKEIQATFDEVGFRPAASFWEAAPTPLEPTAFLALNEGTPFRHLRLVHKGKVFHLVTLSDVEDAEAVRAELASFTEVTVVDKAGTVSRLLSEVRRQGVLWLSVAFLLALSILSVRYGIRRSLLLLLPTAIGVAWAPVLGGACGVPFSVFGLMALMLVLGVGVNYSIFLWEGGDRSKSALAGVLASCCTTLLSFGLLAFCSMPALRWLGTTLTFGILVAFLLTPLSLLGRTED